MQSLRYKFLSVAIASVPRFQFHSVGTSESYFKLLGYLYRTMDLERIEEHLSDKDPKFFEKIVSRALRDGKYDEAVGIINRNPFLDELIVSRVSEEIREIIKDKSKNLSKIPHIIQRDCFDPASFIFPELLLSETGSSPLQNFFRLADYKFVLNENVHFLDRENDKILDNFMASVHRRKELEIALDTEQSIYDNKGEVSLIQISSWDSILLIDGTKLSTNPRLSNFIKELLENDKIQKIGHAVASNEASKIIHLVKGKKISNLTDTRKLFLLTFPDEKKSSLKHISKVLFDKELCKVEQISNWSKRPLRKAQLHYAAADAYILLLIKSKLLSLAPIDLKTGFLSENITTQTSGSDEPNLS